MKQVIALTILSLCISAHAGVDDYLIYNKSHRGELSGLDAIVEVRVNHYYAFSPPDILSHFIKERNKHLECWKEGVMRRGTSGKYWNSLPDENALLLLNRHSVWVVDAVITNVLMGECAEKNIYIAMKEAPGYSIIESPRYLLRSADDYERRVLGLVKISKDEFLREFRHMHCYLQDCQDVLWKREQLPELHEPHAYKFYWNTCASSGGVDYYVMREVGFENQPSEKLKRLGLKMRKSSFLEQVDELREKGAERKGVTH